MNLHPGINSTERTGENTMVLLFTVLELGRATFADPRVWMTPITIRSSVIVVVVGGWSAMLRAYLMVHLFGARGIGTSGCPVVVNGVHVSVWAKIVHYCSGWRRSAASGGMERGFRFEAMLVASEYMG